jgi:hypothetical protein
MVTLFMIIGKNEPLYEVDLEPAKASADAAHAHSSSTALSSLSPNINLFILHSSLDMLELLQWNQHGT